MEENKEINNIKLCKCGCGKPVKEGSEFLQGHYSTWKKKQPKEEKDQPKEPEQKPLIISDVQQIAVDESDDLPWFEDAQGNRKPEMYNFIGIHENIPCVLVMTVYGRLIPPYLIQGFIGMFPKHHEFPEHPEEPQKKQETQHIAPEEDKPPNPLIEPIISPLEEEKFAHVIPQEPIHAQVEKKQSLLGRILGKKEKATTEKTTSSSDLAKRIIEAQST